MQILTDVLNELYTTDTTKRITGVTKLRACCFTGLFIKKSQISVNIIFYKITCFSAILYVVAICFILDLSLIDLSNACNLKF